MQYRWGTPMISRIHGDKEKGVEKLSAEEEWNYRGITFTHTTGYDSKADGDAEVHTRHLADDTPIRISHIRDRPTRRKLY